MTLLPTEKSSKETNPFSYTTLVYGVPKIGKSTSCSRIPDALFVPTEAGLKNLEVFKTPLVETWRDFLAIATEIAEGKHPFKTIIIDTLDGLYRICAKYVCLENGWKHESDIDFGRAHTRIALELLRALTKLSYLPYGLVLIGHSKSRKVRKQTETYDQASLTMSDSVQTIIVGFLDICIYCTTEVRDGKTVRIIKTTPSKDHLAGGRITFYEDGMLLEDLFKQQTIKGGSK